MNFSFNFFSFIKWFYNLISIKIILLSTILIFGSIFFFLSVEFILPFGEGDLVYLIKFLKKNFVISTSDDHLNNFLLESFFKNGINRKNYYINSIVNFNKELFISNVSLNGRYDLYLCWLELDWDILNIITSIKFPAFIDVIIFKSDYLLVNSGVTSIYYFFIKFICLVFILLHSYISLITLIYDYLYKRFLEFKDQKFLNLFFFIMTFFCIYFFLGIFLE
tara:strand:+ start:915 stop:1577 length:663 start_codon:yes stop_codon:yes gene_type:complete